MTGYYDIVLGLIPLSFAGLTAFFLLVGLSQAIAIPLASIAALGLIGHAMFINSPGQPRPRTETARRTQSGREPPIGGTAD